MNLPKQSHEQKLERESYRHLLMLFEEDFHSEYGFIVSDHKSYDYGVDCNLELTIGGEVTNFNCHVQLKAIDKLEKTAKNTDDSYSIQIKTSNINYLLNATKSLYILYVNSKSEFYYAWADEFISTLIEKDKDWLYKPSKKSLRFYNKIDKQALLDIYNEIRKQAKLFRKVSENLSGYNNAILPKSSNLIINMDNFEVKSENEIIKFIEENGEQLLNQRKENLLIEMSEKLTESIQNSPLACLILGIASFESGFAYKALDYIIKANRNISKLNEKYKAVLKFHEVNFKYVMGLISDRHLEKQKIGYEGHQLYLEFLQIENNFRTSTEEDTEEKLIPIRNFVKKMEGLSKKYPKIYLQSKIQLLRAEGWLVNLQFRNQTYREENGKKLDKLSNNIQQKVRKYGDIVLEAIYIEAYVSFLVTNLSFEYKQNKDSKKFNHLNYQIDTAFDIFVAHHRHRNACVSILTKFKLYKYFEYEKDAEVIRKGLFKLLNFYDFIDLQNEVIEIEEAIDKFN